MESPKLQFVFSSLYMSMYFLLVRMVETLHKTNSAGFISFLITCAFYQQSLPLAYWWIRKGWKGKIPGVVLSFPFLLCHHFGVCGCLMQWSNRSKIEFLSNKIEFLFTFLECHCCLLVVKANSGSRWKSPLVAVRTPTYSVLDVAYLTCARFEFCGTHTCCGSTRVLCFRGAFRMLCANRA